eukprot:GFYU01006268.1.p2 GENE.GFYU01006268.1~~GFYU01006268.1.p2  ORF type:complete len:196 (-),score=56.33 GFYU01006268.1:225-812(-)
MKLTVVCVLALVAIACAVDLDLMRGKKAGSAAAPPAGGDPTAMICEKAPMMMKAMCPMAVKAALDTVAKAAAGAPNSVCSDAIPELTEGCDVSKDPSIPPRPSDAPVVQPGQSQTANHLKTLFGAAASFGLNDNNQKCQVCLMIIKQARTQAAAANPPPAAPAPPAAPPAPPAAPAAGHKHQLKTAKKTNRKDPK